MKRVVVFGGSGFVGRYITKKLANLNCVIKIVCRDLDAANQLKVCGNLGQISVSQCNLSDEKSIKNCIDGSEFVINLIGIIEEDKKYTFEKIHHIAAKQIAKAAAECDVKGLVHFSAIANKNTKYGSSKLQGEIAVKKAFNDAIIVRPSVIFGQEDNFFNLFATIAKKIRVLPLVCRGRSLLQPVYVADVAEFVCSALFKEGCKGCSYDLVGPQRYSLKEIMLFVRETLSIKCFLVPLPYYLALFKAFFLESSLLKPLNKFLTGSTRAMLTRDQVKSLCFDSVSDDNCMEKMGIRAKTIQEIVPQYIKGLHG